MARDVRGFFGVGSGNFKSVHAWHHARGVMPHCPTVVIITEAFLQLVQLPAYVWSASKKIIMVYRRRLYITSENVIYINFFLRER
jgi:nicotinic acid mononucleotide adenylyltransferase